MFAFSIGNGLSEFGDAVVPLIAWLLECLWGRSSPTLRRRCVFLTTISRPESPFSEPRQCKKHPPPSDAARGSRRAQHNMTRERPYDLFFAGQRT